MFGYSRMRYIFCQFRANVCVISNSHYCILIEDRNGHYYESVCSVWEQIPGWIYKLLSVLLVLFFFKWLTHLILFSFLHSCAFLSERSTHHHINTRGRGNVIYLWGAQFQMMGWLASHCQISANRQLHI